MIENNHSNISQFSTDNNNKVENSNTNLQSKNLLNIKKEIQSELEFSTSLPQQKQKIKFRDGFKIYIIRIIRTLPYLYLFFIMGGWTSIFGPTLIMLGKNINNEERVGWIFIPRSFGYCFGSFFGGFLFDVMDHYQKKYVKFYQKTGRNKIVNMIMKFFTSMHIMMIVFLMVVIIPLFLHPFIHSLGGLLVLGFFIGFGNGVCEVGVDVLINLVWRKQVNIPIQASHFAYGSGALTFPLVVASILKNEKLNHLVVSYSSCSICCVLGIIPLIILPCPSITRLSEEQFSKKEEDKKKNVKRKNLKTNLYYFLVAIFYVFYAGSEFAFSGLIVSYLVRKKMDTEIGGSYLTSLFFVFFTLGRFLGIIESLFIPPFVLLVFNTLMCCYCTVVLLIFQNNLAVFRVFICLLGFFMSLIFALNYTLPKILFGFEITGIGTSFILIGASSGFVFPSLIEYSSIKYPNSLLYFGVVVSFLQLIWLGVEYFVGKGCSKTEKSKIIPAQKEKKTEEKELE